jgi:hypothetical protein
MKGQGMDIPMPLDQAAQRYSALVDQKHLTGLTPVEEQELTRLDALLSDAEEPFYHDLIERLRSTLPAES